jgi:hypothetical protein
MEYYRERYPEKFQQAENNTTFRVRVASHCCPEQRLSDSFTPASYLAAYLGHLRASRGSCHPCCATDLLQAGTTCMCVGIGGCLPIGPPASYAGCNSEPQLRGSGRHAADT